MITKKLRPVGISEFSENLFCFFGLLGLNLNAINLNLFLRASGVLTYKCTAHICPRVCREREPLNLLQFPENKISYLLIN